MNRLSRCIPFRIQTHFIIDIKYNFIIDCVQNKWQDRLQLRLTIFWVFHKKCLLVFWPHINKIRSATCVKYIRDDDWTYIFFMKNDLARVIYVKKVIVYHIFRQRFTHNYYNFLVFVVCLFWLNFVTFRKHFIFIVCNP